MLLKNAANKVTKLFSKLSPESQIKLHSSGVWNEYPRYANVEMGLRDRLLDVDEQAMKFLKEHPDDYRAGLLRMAGSEDDLSYLLAHGVTPEELAANPYFRMSESSAARGKYEKTLQMFGGGAATMTSHPVLEKTLLDKGMKDELKKFNRLARLRIAKKFNRMRILSPDPFTANFDDAFKAVKEDPELVKSLLVFGKDGRVDPVATHRNVLREAARRSVPDAPNEGFLNVSNDGVDVDRFGRKTGIVYTDADINDINVGIKRQALKKLKELYVQEKRKLLSSGKYSLKDVAKDAFSGKRSVRDLFNMARSSGKMTDEEISREAYLRAKAILESRISTKGEHKNLLASISSPENNLDDISYGVFLNNHESSEVKHAVKNILESGTFRPEGVMFKESAPPVLSEFSFLMRPGMAQKRYNQTGQHYGIGVLADELADTNGPAYWRARGRMYDATDKSRPFITRNDTGEQKFLAGILGLGDKHALGRGVEIPEKDLERLRALRPKVISGGNGATYIDSRGELLPSYEYRYGYEMD